MSEIDLFPRAVLSHHFPETPLHGDFTTIRAGDYEPIDLLVGGTPCQSFSVAGLRGGMEDARGNLALEYLRLADRLRPRWVVWENVPGVRSSNGGRDFGAFLGGLGQLGYGWAYRSLDAQYLGLAQRRERVFVVGYLGDWRRAAAVLFEPASLRGDPPPGRKTREGVANAIRASASPNGHGNSSGLRGDGSDNLIADIAPTISSRPTGGGGLGTDFDLDGGLITATIANTLRVPSHGATWRGDGYDNLVAPPLTSNPYGDHESREGLLVTSVALRGRTEGGTAEPGGDVASSLRASTGGGDKPHVLAYGGNNTAGPIDVATAVNAHGGPHGRLDFESETFIADLRNGTVDQHTAMSLQSGGMGTDRGLCPNAIPHVVTHALRADGFDASEDGTGRGTPLVTHSLGAHRAGSVTEDGTGRGVPLAPIKSGVRRLTPVECERLQGFPDNYTNVPYRGKLAADGPRYKALGNSMAVPVMAWIGKRIAQVDK